MTDNYKARWHKCEVPSLPVRAGDIVLLHLWLRQQQVGGRLSITGVGFMEALSHIHTYAQIILLQPPQVARALQLRPPVRFL